MKKIKKLQFIIYILLILNIRVYSKEINNINNVKPKLFKNWINQFQNLKPNILSNGTSDEKFIILIIIFTIIINYIIKLLINLIKKIFVFKTLKDVFINILIIIIILNLYNIKVIPKKNTTNNNKKIKYFIKKFSLKYNVDYRLVTAIIIHESNFNHLAISNKGAIGLMQIMPATGKIYGVNNKKNLFKIDVNLNVGIKYLKDLFKKYKYKSNQLKLVIAAYNCGPTRVINKVPNFKETKLFVKKVQNTYFKLKNL